MPFRKGNKSGRDNRGLKRTAIWLERQRLARLGKHYSPKTQFRKGHKTWNKGKNNPYAKNLPHKFKKGQKPHNWKGGISPFRALVRSSVEYKLWRSDVFHRDNFTCQNCGIRGGYLEADHFPRPFSKILDHFKIETMEQARLCEPLWDIANGRTLCESCHRFFTYKK